MPLNDKYMTELLFFLFSSILLSSSLVVITARNPIHSVLFMILVFLNVVFILISLEVEFLALTFVIVYVGAVAVLFLFVVMMLNIKITSLNKELIHYFPIGGLVGLIFLFNVILVMLSSGVNSSLTSRVLKKYDYIDWLSLVDSPTNIEVIGQVVYTAQSLYFIISGLVLLVAMIGAIVLTNQNKDKSIRTQQVFQQLSRNFKKAIFLTRPKKK
jgi:NADH-quinone oxidoreductase subunit J